MMPSTDAGPRELVDLVQRFVDAFNREDLDAVMEFFREDAVYEEFNGKSHRGKRAIREAFEPQFRGDYGAIRFDTLDVFVDETARKALVRWLCRLDGKSGGWHGLDVIVFDGKQIVEKLTYAKAEVPLIQR
jgi:uncharacterized protein (TIGR02246 family)